MNRIMDYDYNPYSPTLPLGCKTKSLDEKAKRDTQNITHNDKIIYQKIFLFMIDHKKLNTYSH